MKNEGAIVSLPGVVIQFVRSFFRIGAWCNGSTADFESVNPGSSPGAPAR